MWPVLIILILFSYFSTILDYVIFELFVYLYLYYFLISFIVHVSTFDIISRDALLKVKVLVSRCLKDKNSLSLFDKEVVRILRHFASNYC